ncbi:homeobox protein CDX-2 [Pteropus vampyrus]|uniref:Homeobox protein CDX-2 n=1 Tax=Pteropus vampyrus TaxID=132908 RepID=A0A6P6CGT3_PTEVA|nr:homeobox protein CDX-2 [Pteropus vampyrus]
MYVSYLLDKDVSMYPSSVRHSGGLNLAPQNFVSPPQYPDYGGYHVAAAAAAAANLDTAQSPGPSWPAAYGAPLREPGRRPVMATSQRCLAYVSRVNQSAAGGCLWAPVSPPLGTCQDRPVKTRTKDKYRVVYTDHQRLELEKEFHYSRYITIRRKAELAATLGLSERQVKIWFQNRRAKERKINKKKLQQQQQPPPPAPQPPPPQPGPLRSVPEPLSPVSSLQGSVPGVLGPTGGVLNPTVTQ